MYEDQSKVLVIADDRCELLLKAALPEMYRINAFRILGLSVDATPQQIKRREQEYATYLKMGLTLSEINQQIKILLPLKPLPDEDTVRQAFQRLRDPESRLVDEFFWLWPAEGSSIEDDEALSVLIKGDSQGAINIWLKHERENSESMTSIHNLAVIFHLLALDMEYTGISAPLQENQLKQKQAYWKVAYTRWRDCLAKPGLWERLTRRIRELDDPRLTSDISNKFKATLPEGLLLINAALAVRAAQAKNKNEAAQQIRHLQESCLDKALIVEVLNTITAPMRERINLVCEAASKESEKNPEHSHISALNLINQTAPLLATIDSLLPANHLSRQAVHDEVAIKVMLMLIDFCNKTSNWKIVKSPLEYALSIALSESARQRIEKNMTIINSNIDLCTCWFCKANPSEEASELSVKMHGNITRTPTWRGTVEITWNHITLTVPRCSKCKKFHKRTDVGTGLGGLFGGIIGIFAGIGLGLGEDSAFCGFIIGLGVLIAIGCAIGGAIGKAAAPKGVQPSSAMNKYPSVKEKLSAGWQFGEKPPNVQ